MKILERLKFRIGRWALNGLSRGYSEIASTSRQMSDWIMSGISEDADLQANWPALVQKSRDLFKTNPYMRKFRVDLIANVFGSEGITLQMKIKEEADRVVYMDDARKRDGEHETWALAEKAWLEAKQRSREELIARGAKLPKRTFVHVTTTGSNGSSRAKATVKAGQPDVYANNLIERAWKRWQKRENCTVSRRHTYAQTREQRLTMCARDGDVFIRHVRGFDNEFGYAIQLISSEWIDHALCQDLGGGRYIKMGIEYDQWSAVTAYYIIKRDGKDWRNNYTYGIGTNYSGTTQSAYSPQRHERVEARDMIHYCLFEDAESGRSAPWIASVMNKLRHLDKYSEAEVISARAEACKGGHYYSDLALGPDAMLGLGDELKKTMLAGEQINQVVEPAMWRALPYGWKAQAHDPKHPNGNYPDFKKECLREVSVGIGGFYNTFAGDLEGVNFTSSRAGFMDVREFYKWLQVCDVDIAERPIFEAFLEMALAKGAIPLPLAKFDKFNAPAFQGRRWDSVQPIDDIRADRLAVEGNLNSRTRLLAEAGRDFEEVIEELAMEKVIIEEAGLQMMPVKVSNDAASETEPAAGTEEEPPTKPKKSHMGTRV